MNRLYVAFIGMSLISGGLAVARYSSAKQIHGSPDARVQFVGAWKLVSTEEKLKDGSTRPYQDVGPHGTGYLMYSADGHMCAELTGADRPKWDVPATTAQKISAVNTFTAYCGRFEVDEVHHIMWHHPEVALDPNFVGTKQPRPYRFEGNRLIFSDKQAEEEDDQTVDRWTIVWEKQAK
jgi:Lipocalin-like domain